MEYSCGMLKKELLRVKVQIMVIIKWPKGYYVTLGSEPNCDIHAGVVESYDLSVIVSIEVNPPVLH